MPGCPEVPALLTPIEVAQRLRVTTRTVHRWSDRGILPAQILPNGQRRYRTSDVDAALQDYQPSDQPFAARTRRRLDGQRTASSRGAA